MEFGSFMDDMAMVCTFVAGDETGGMTQSASSPGVSSQYHPQVSQALSTAATTTFSSRNRDDPNSPVFSLGAAAIVSTKRAPASSSVVVDMDEIQSALSADLSVDDLIAAASAASYQQSPPLIAPVSISIPTGQQSSPRTSPQHAPQASSFAATVAAAPQKRGPLPNLLSTPPNFAAPSPPSITLPQRPAAVSNAYHPSTAVSSAAHPSTIFSKASHPHPSTLPHTAPPSTFSNTTPSPAAGVGPIVSFASTEPATTSQPTFVSPHRPSAVSSATPLATSPEKKIVTRGVRAAGHSDAPRPLGFPAIPARPSMGANPGFPSASPSSTNAYITAKTTVLQQPTATTSATTASSAPASPSPSTPSPTGFDSGYANGSGSPAPRSETPPTPPTLENGDSNADGTGVRTRTRPQSLLPIPLPVSRTGGFATFEEFLLDPNINLLKALCTCLQVTEATKTCASITMIFESKQRTLGMIQSMIEYEVSLQKTAATLFRNNSLTTHMMTCYTKLVGLPFLKTVVGPVILDAFTAIDAGDVTYEIDPSKLGPGEDLKTNVGDLKRLVHSFFDRILNSRAVMPRNFMEICHTLQHSTVDRFPESRYFVIGGFLFLRYICPAVVAPDGYKLIGSLISEKQRRMLVLVSKILQTIANERTFGDKEDYMMCMNQLVNEYQSIVQYFFNQLAKPVLPNTPDNAPTLVINSEDYQLALKQVLAQVKASKTKLSTHPLITADPRLVSVIENLENIPLM